MLLSLSSSYLLTGVGLILKFIGADLVLVSTAVLSLVFLSYSVRSMSVSLLCSFSLGKDWCGISKTLPVLFLSLCLIYILSPECLSFAKTILHVGSYSNWWFCNRMSTRNSYSAILHTFFLLQQSVGVYILNMKVQ
jgi:hypothetical protein